jgi:DNA primase
MPPAPAAPTQEGRAAAQALSSELDLNAAALAAGAMLWPQVMDDHLEALERHGFGDPALRGLASAMIALRLEGEILDMEALRRHLAHSGFEALMRDVEKAAVKSRAPFLAPDAPFTTAASQWSQAFTALTRLAALEEALAAAKSVVGNDGAFRLLKAERDAARRAIKTGTIWEAGAS